ncbi:uncharacterized protein LOC112053193 [Bicyclus anynana]|uniref:Uncharacterized protein LOC112053193 n=1 Tax=Bicyclus anynana TaxID=110368 RepID=A0A6J1NKK7_BICAN|nr:uncharacterized protein LOC112053193 [Bicyclus anynana]
MADDIITSVTELYKQKNWKAIVEIYREHPERNKLLWVFPTEENFHFITQYMEELKCSEILSVGCGSGLLEWIITEATGYPVSGLEVDGAWWQCKYAPPTFIPLKFTSPELDKATTALLQDSKSTALLFCYFNNGPAFKQYLDYYSGKMLIIIGPEYGKGVHTDPRPFGDVPDTWTLRGWQEVASTRDFIAVYYKNK